MERFAGLFKGVDERDARPDSHCPKPGLDGLRYSLEHYAVHVKPAYRQAGGDYDYLVKDTFVHLARITRQELPGVNRDEFLGWLDNSFRNHMNISAVGELLTIEATNLRPEVLRLLVKDDDDEVVPNVLYRKYLDPYLQHLARIIVRASRISVAVHGVGINEATPQLVLNRLVTTLG